MEQITRHPVHELQHDILEKICSEAGERLSAAPDRNAALIVRQALCERLERECVSSVVAGGARAFMDGLIDSRWRDDGSRPTHDQH